MIPGTIGVASYQINVLLTQGLAFFLGTGIVIQFQYAVRMMELPQGVFGISLATFLLPTLAGLAAAIIADAGYRRLEVPESRIPAGCQAILP